MDTTSWFFMAKDCWRSNFSEHSSISRWRTLPSGPESAGAGRDTSGPAPPSLTEFLNSQLQNQFETENAEDTQSSPVQAQSENKTTIRGSPTSGGLAAVSTQNLETKTSSSSDLSSSTKTNPNPIKSESGTRETTSTATTTLLPLEVVQTTPESGATQSTTTLATEKTTRAKLSPADYLKLCFVSQIGCDFDFSQNEVDNSTAATTTTTSTTTAAERTVPSVPSEISAERREELRQRVQACFLTGICEDGDSLPEVEEEKVEVVEERTERPRLITTPDYASDIQRVQERARACFFRGEC